MSLWTRRWLILVVSMIDLPGRLISQHACGTLSWLGREDLPPVDDAIFPGSGLSQTHPRFLIPFHEYLGLPPSLGAPPHTRLMLPHILGRHPLTQIIHTSNPVWTCASQRTQTNPSFTQKTTELSSLSGYTGSKCRFVMFCLQFKIQNSLKLPRFVFTLLKAIGFLWVFHLVKHLATKSLMCLVRGVFSNSTKNKI